MTERPWETEDSSLDFEADGLTCAMRRAKRWGPWCGYVAVGPAHPLFGLPVNHPLKLPERWFDNRRGLEGTGPIDVFRHLLGGKPLTEACAISLALQVHGGVNYAADCVPGGKRGGSWWFGFDCGHGGDYIPCDPDFKGIIDEVIESMPEAARASMRQVMLPIASGVYRDQPYVVSECQSLAAQLIAIAKLIEGVTTAARHSDR